MRCQHVIALTIFPRKRLTLQSLMPIMLINEDIVYRALAMIGDRVTVTGEHTLLSHHRRGRQCVALHLMRNCGLIQNIDHSGGL